MGFFSKPKLINQATLPEDQIQGIISKFQNWIPENVSKEVNGELFTSSELKSAVDFLVRVSNTNQDELLLIYVAKICAGFANSMKEESIEQRAQQLFDLTVASMDLRKKYQSESNITRLLTALGICSLQAAESHPKYSEILTYMSENSHKLNKN